MKIVFIADAHITGPGDANLQGLAAFIDALEDVDTLVVLGDLFEFWTKGNSVARSAYAPVLDSFLRLSGRGTGIIYVEGNHDFSMGGFFTETLGATVSAGSFDLGIGEKRFYLAHGDTVAMSPCYGLWRSFLRGRLFGVLAAILPDSLVWSVAMRLAARSRGRARCGGYGDNGDQLEGRLREFARGWINDGYDGVILGHSHRPGVHVEECGGRRGIYANPGAWSVRGTYLECDDGRFEIREVGA